jgi:multiple sugar transport system ATP-binding protein
VARVAIEQVSKIFKGAKGERVSAVHQATFTVSDKEFLVLVGPSGCGKSTLLRLIAGLEEITQGTIAIDGQVVNEIAPKDRDIAMVFQNYALYPHMTVFENMAFSLKLRKFPKTEIQKRVQEAAEILELSPYLQRKPAALSGGQRQRVAVGRAIVRRPKVFLFDEPLSNLDAQMRVQMRAEICQLHRRLEATMIYVTHDQVEAMTMGDRIAVMKEGVVQQIADPMHLYRQPANRFVAGFIGSPPMNFLPGSLRPEGEALYFVGQGGEQMVTMRVDRKHLGVLAGRRDRSIVLGLRPEQITLSSSVASPGRGLTATVEMMELTGVETYLHLAAGGHRFVARVPGGTLAKVGQKMSLDFAMDQAHFFDPETGVAIGEAINK